MAREIIIIGSGRQGRNVSEIFSSNLSLRRRSVVGFIDDTKKVGDMVLGLPILGGLKKMDDRKFVTRHDWHIALGNSQVRQSIGQLLKNTGATIVNAIHPTAEISRYCQIGCGVYVGAFVRVYSCSRIEDWALLEAYSCVGCDCVVGSGAFLGPACVLTGGAVVGERSFLGAGTVVCNDIRVGSSCVIGANAVVVRNIPDETRAQGVPARIQTSHSPNGS